MSTHLISAHARDGRAPTTERFRNRLQRELALRCGRNARYSLRAFANYLGIDHATLSQLLRGKRSMTAPTIRRLGARIGLTAAEIAQYVALESSAPAVSTDEVRKLAGDAAKVFGDWHAFAVLALMRLQEFRPDVRWIARMLGLSADEVNIALQHLLRLDFLRMAATDRWIDLTGGTVLHEEDFTLLALERLITRSRSLHEASARIAPDAARLLGSATLAVDAATLAQLLALSERFLAEARALAGRQPGDRLYHLELHCVPLSTPPEQPS